MKVIYTDDPKILEAYRRIRNGELLDGETPDAIQTYGDRAVVPVSPIFRGIKKHAAGAGANYALGLTGYGAGVIPAINKAAKEYEESNPNLALGSQVAGAITPIPFFKALGVGRAARSGAKAIGLDKALKGFRLSEHPILRNAALGAGLSASHDALYDRPEDPSKIASNAVTGALGGGALGMLGSIGKSFLSPRYKANKFLKHFDKKIRDRSVEENMPLYKLLGSGGQEHEIAYMNDILSNYPKTRSRIPSKINNVLPEYPPQIEAAYKAALKGVPDYNLANSPLPEKAVQEYRAIAAKMPDLYDIENIYSLSPKQQEQLKKQLGARIKAAQEAGDNVEAAGLTQIAEALSGNLGEKYAEASHMAKPFKLDRERTRRNIAHFKGLGEALLSSSYNPSNVPVGELASKSIQQQTKNPAFSKATSVWQRLLSGKGITSAMKQMNPKENQIFNVVFGNPRISLKAMEKFAKGGGKYKNLPDDIIEALSRTKLYREDN